MASLERKECTALQCTELHQTAFQCTVLHCNAPYCTYTALYWTSFYCTALYINLKSLFSGFSGGSGLTGRNLDMWTMLAFSDLYPKIWHDFPMIEIWWQTSRIPRYFRYILRNFKAEIRMGEAKENNNNKVYLYL